MSYDDQFFFSTKKNYNCKKNLFQNFIDNKVKKFNYLYPKGEIYMGHCRDHNCLIICVSLNGHEKNYPKGDGSMTAREYKN